MIQALTDILLSYGYWGMLIAAFIAGSFFPFPSEVVMLGLYAAGLDSDPLIIYGTIGNVLGSMFNYSIGRLGRLEWVEKYLHVKKKNIDKAQRFVAGHGAWIGIFAFIPILGSAITICLGLMRANIIITIASITAGKLGRYIILMTGAGLVAS
jgi:membrane protein YqaA with SNARE-associated domain